MLIELDEIYTFKLTNGDEIVAKIVDIDLDRGYYDITRPLTVIPGQQGLQLVMSLFTANPDKPIRLNNITCVMISCCRAEVRDSYVEATTGIKPVTNKILMG